jgi:molecular chaperone DnaJ
MSPHEVFLRKGQDLYMEHAVPLDIAMRGGMTEVPTLGGPPLSIEVPVGLVPGRTVVPIRGAGIPSVMRDERGDLYVTFQVSMPEVKTPRAERLLQELLDEIKKSR